MTLNSTKNKIIFVFFLLGESAASGFLCADVSKHPVLSSQVV